MHKYIIYYNQKRKYVAANSPDIAYLGMKCWFLPDTILFIEDVQTKEIKKYIV